jgi:hypothetical protein
MGEPGQLDFTLTNRISGYKCVWFSLGRPEHGDKLFQANWSWPRCAQLVSTDIGFGDSASSGHLSKRPTLGQSQQRAAAIAFP